MEKIEKAISLNPRHPQWYFRALAIAQLFDKKYEASARSFEKLLANTRVSHAYYVWLAAAWALAGKPEAAKRIIRERKQQLRINPHHLTTVQAIGRAWPLPKEQRAILYRGLRLAGIPEGSDPRR